MLWYVATRCIVVSVHLNRVYYGRMYVCVRLFAFVCACVWVIPAYVLYAMLLRPTLINHTVVILIICYPCHVVYVYVVCLSGVCVNSGPIFYDVSVFCGVCVCVCCMCVRMSDLTCVVKRQRSYSL